MARSLGFRLDFILIAAWRAWRFNLPGWQTQLPEWKQIHEIMQKPLGSKGSLFGSTSVSNASIVFGDSLGEGIAVNSENFGGFGEVFLVPGESFLYVNSLELGHGFVQ